ncbi:hypothetical protein [Pseudomonas sp. 57B-090624]|uniref:hypothetical protein n=1 Tax=Pseudomonas sp. 57B-090624 TaxID=2213080 RepID=UPI0011B789C1|nr:hypothetical protein [Pseudomonas sp. 57B-090624]
MAMTKTSKAGGLGIQCRELTVEEIRDWLKSMEARTVEPDLVRDSLLPDFTLDDLERMTNATAEQLGGMTPSELRELGEDCKAVNPDFFDLRARVGEAGRQLLAKLSGSLNETLPA